ncbi:MAG: branched chain amino acid aminotransferase [Cyclobacteriaceae bacterium]|nr:MAG: branched chain amino acid aminotransferase [Cyclobacteriaceae bacterium]
MSFTWINGIYKKDSEASLHISDLAIQRGYGVFDFFRVRQKRPFLIGHYLDRFFNSAERLNLTVPMSKSSLLAVIHEFIEKNELTDYGIKMILTGGYSDDSYTPAKPNLIIRGHQITPPAPKKYQQGIRIMTNEHQRGTPECKSLDYRQGITLLPQLQKKELDDVLYYFENKITEFPRSNFFMVDQKNRVITPARHILEGITRNVLITVAANHYSVEERDIFLDELPNAREAFLTSTTKLVMPICEIDGSKVGSGVPGPITKHLSALMNQLPSDYHLS